MRDRSYVSERARELVEAQDDFGHQFHPVRVQEHRHRPTVFCHEHAPLRVYRPDQRGIGDKHYSDELLGLDFSTSLFEVHYLPSILHNTALRERLEALPLWIHFTGDWPRYKHRYSVDYPPLYLKEAMLRALQQASVNGLDEYSRYGGKRGVCRPCLIAW